MKKNRILASLLQTLEFNSDVTVEKCPDKEYSYLDCIKIGDDYYLPNIEWTKYSPADTKSGDDSGSFKPVEGSEWEVIHHAIIDEKEKVHKA